MRQDSSDDHREDLRDDHREDQRDDQRDDRVTLDDLRDDVRIEDPLAGARDPWFRQIENHVGAEGVPRGEAGIDAGFVGEAGEGGNGAGEGRGAGRGPGLGLGDGARIADAPVSLETPAAPKASKARVAKLVYPVRERQVDESELFVARVTIDHEGFVVGARLVRGFGGPRDAMAADLIWKFRYAPALDDDGTPIRSTFDQRFLVGR